MREAIVGMLLAAWSTIASAAGERSPWDYSVITYVWVLALSAFGGLVNWTRKIKAGHARPFNLVEFVGEIATSAFAGLLTFWLTESAGTDKMISAVLIAISGHMGSRTLFALERWAQAKFGASAPAEEPAAESKAER